MSAATIRRLFKLAIALTILFSLVWFGRLGYRAWQFRSLFKPQMIADNFRNMNRLFDTNLVKRSGPVINLTYTEQVLPSQFRFMDETISVSNWIETSGTTGLVVIANDRIVFERYYQGNNAQSSVISWSIGKSFVSALVGFAVADGKIELGDPVEKHVPMLKNSGYEGVSIQDVLEMSTGIDFSENYADSESGICKLGEEIFFGRSTNDWITMLRKKPSLSVKEFDYISANTQILGMVLEAATEQKLSAYMEQKLWARLGVEADAVWLTDAHGTELAFCGLCMRTRDYARFGLLYLNQGRNQKGEQLLPPDWIQQSVTPRTDYLQPGRNLHQGIPTMGYAYHFWVPHGEEGEFMAIGVYGQFIYVNRLRRVVIAKNSAYIDYNKDGELMEYQAIEAFRAIARQVGSH